MYVMYVRWRYACVYVGCMLFPVQRLALCVLCADMRLLVKCFAGRQWAYKVNYVDCVTKYSGGNSI